MELKIADLITSLNHHPHWHKEVELVIEIYELLNRPSIRDLAQKLNRDKTWTGLSVRLAIGMRKYPDLKRCRNRYQAMLFMKRKSYLFQ